MRVWTGSGKWRSGILAALVLILPCISLAFQAVQATEKSIAIGRDFEDNITVAIDPAVISDIQIRRGNGKMMIELLDSADTKAFSIEPILKKAQLVDVGKGPNGRVITIHSNRVFLSIQDLSLNRSQAKAESIAQSIAPAPAIGPDSVAAKKQDSPKPGVTLSPPPEKPQERSVKMAEAITVKAMGSIQPSEKPLQTALKTPAKQAPTPKAPPQKSEAARQPEPAPQTAERKTPARKAPAPRPEVARQPEPATPEASPAEVSTLAVAEDAPPVDADAGSGIIGEMPPEPELPPAPPIIRENLDFNYSHMPMEVFEAQRKASEEALHQLLWRVFGSLLVVLVLVVAFLKLGLPKLMEKYPGFFEGLKRRHQNREHQGKAYKDKPPRKGLKEKSREKPIDDLYLSGRMPDAHKQAVESRAKTGTVKPAKTSGLLSPLAKLTKKDTGGKRGYLEQLGKADDQFQIRTSQPLGKGKELHLVEIRGRQLVIATTPYTVNLITELDGEQVHPLPVDETAFTHQPTAIQAFIEERQEPEQEVYKKYLPPDEASARPVQDKSRGGETEPVSPPPKHQAYIEAEEVVVLEDYDDIYRP